MSLPVLLSDSRVAAVPVLESGERLVELPASLAPDGALVRAGVAERLHRAGLALPGRLRLRVVEGHRSAADQQLILDRYRAQVRDTYPQAAELEMQDLTSRFVAPLAVAPHVAGAAVDLSLVDDTGRELDLGTPIDATPEASAGRCYFSSPDISLEARALRLVLAEALTQVGLVNYPTEWWHWSYGDRYWALMTGSPVALYGPVAELAPAGAGC